MVKKILIIILIAIIIGAAYGLYMWNKPKRNFTDATPDVSLSADSLFNSFSRNEKHADSLYLNKVIQVTGKVSQISANQNKGKVVVLQSSDPIFGISCTMLNSDSVATSKLKTGDKVNIKGLCNGFLTDVVLTNSTVVK
jgi:hypothetical protein